ncbi:lysostaphin resistance A-like protein [Lactococcus lactis]|uniref:CPBP family intramembrane glutamic endopeptidase n=1 Tax=Lactococcus lactis TaxID=1358 RepID=UPI00398E6E23
MFRSYIFGSITNKKIAFLISSLLFALVHTGFSWYLLPYLILSFIITWVYSKRNNFIESAIVHSSVNLFSGSAIKLLDTFFKLLPY